MRGGRGGSLPGPDLIPNSQCGLGQALSFSSLCFSLCQMRVWKVLINPHSELHKGGAFVSPFHRRENRHGEASCTTAIQLEREALNLGLSAFRVCVLNGLMAKAALSVIFSHSKVPYGKGIYLLEDQRVQCPAAERSLTC